LHLLFRSGVYEQGGPDLAQLLGRAAMTLEEYIATAIAE